MTKYVQKNGRKRENEIERMNENLQARKSVVEAEHTSLEDNKSTETRRDTSRHCTDRRNLQ
jgi:hypothetical protein